MINIRPIQESDRKFLWDMLFEMIYFPEESGKPNKEELFSYKYIWTEKYFLI